MNRAAKPQHSKTQQAKQSDAASKPSGLSDATSDRRSKLSLLAMALIGGVLASSQLVTGDSVTITSGDTLPQVLLILVTAFVASLAGWKVLPESGLSRLPLVWLALVIAGLLISTIAATHRADGRAAWNGCWHLIAVIVFALVVSQAARRPALARTLFQFIVLCAVFQSTYSLHQYFISMPAARAEYLADPEAALMKAEVDAPAGSELRMQYESRLLGSFEPPGTFALTNSLAVLLSGVIVALGWHVWSARSSASALSLWSARLLLAFMILIWLLTKSRTGYLAVFTVVIAALFIQRMMPAARSTSQADAGPSTERASSGIIFAVAALVLTGLAIAFLASDSLVLSEAPKSVLYRLEYWQASARMILDYPLTGVGQGNFQSYYPAYKLPAASEVIADPHNWLFDVAVTSSLPVLILFVLGISHVLRRGYSQIRQTPDDATITIDSNDRSITVAFWIGAGVSFMLGGFLLLLLNKLISFDATALSFLVTVISWWLLRDIAVGLKRLRWSAWLAAITMLVCLLAAGNYQSSGLALPLVAWLAIAAASQNSVGHETRTTSTSTTWAAPIVCLLTLVAFVFQTWQPVQSSWALGQQAITAYQHGQLDVALALTKQAIAKDPLEPDLRRLQVQITMDPALAAAQRASKEELGAALVRFDAAVEELLATDPISNLNYAYVGECNLAIAAACETLQSDLANDRVKLARDHYNRAVIRYPTSVALLAQAAVLDAWLASASSESLTSEGTAQLSEAFRLSELTPHWNRELGSQQVFLPPALARRFSATAIVRPTPDSVWVKAEPLCEHLRRLTDTTLDQEPSK